MVGDERPISAQAKERHASRAAVPPGRACCAGDAAPPAAAFPQPDRPCCGMSPAPSGRHLAPDQATP
jgi:hypothetical protein